MRTDELLAAVRQPGHPFLNRETVALVWDAVLAVKTRFPDCRRSPSRQPWDMSINRIT
jgi:hypothetical protein